jgi:hypothetical protein
MKRHVAQSTSQGTEVTEWTICDCVEGSPATVIPSPARSAHRFANAVPDFARRHDCASRRIPAGATPSILHRTHCVLVTHDYITSPHHCAPIESWQLCLFYTFATRIGVN